MKNSIIKFNYILDENDKNFLREGNSFNKVFIPLYDFTKIKKILAVISRLDDNEYFGYTSVKNNTTIEKLSYDIYKTPDFWDVLILINNKNPLFSMAYDFDVIYDSVEEHILKYENHVIKRKLSEKERERLGHKLMEDFSIKNEDNRIIRYVYPEKIYDFLQILRENELLWV